MKKLSTILAIAFFLNTLFITRESVIERIKLQ